jgi:nucleoid DNA-binding protein
MTTSEIIKTISQQTGLSQKQVEMYLSIFTTGVEQYIEAKDTTPRAYLSKA